MGSAFVAPTVVLVHGAFGDGSSSEAVATARIADKQLVR